MRGAGQRAAAPERTVGSTRIHTLLSYTRCSAAHRRRRRRRLRCLSEPAMLQRMPAAGCQALAHQHQHQEASCQQAGGGRPHHRGREVARSGGLSSQNLCCCWWWRVPKAVCACGVCECTLPTGLQCRRHCSERIKMQAASRAAGVTKRPPSAIVGHTGCGVVWKSLVYRLATYYS